jgi:ubiquinone/menaquinone biosynthesis C-methylase UbiE
MSEKEKRELSNAVVSAIGAFESVPTSGFGAYLRVQAGLIATIALEAVCADPDASPYPSLLATFNHIGQMPGVAGSIAVHMLQDEDAKTGAHPGKEYTADLFETAWTTYDAATYDHSVGLIDERLRRSGFDKNFFRGKRCFDGGCGTGRFAIAMATAGAKKVVAVDIGGASLSYLNSTCSRRQVDNIETIEHDVTDLSAFDSDSFDFVASQGVLHHTDHPIRGIKEHFRITRPGGIFWLYLYGAGGLYWDTYDHLKDLVRAIEPKVVRQILTNFHVRRGLIYTFLDNMQAPRTYYRLNEVVALLRQSGKFEYRHMRGATAIDDTEKLISSHYGRDIFGPDGEIRLVITKSSDSHAA